MSKIRNSARCLLEEMKHWISVLSFCNEYPQSIFHLWVLIAKRAGIPKGWRFLWLWVSNRGGERPVGRGIQRGQRTLGSGFQRRQNCLGGRNPMEGRALRGRKNPMKPAVSWHTTLFAKSSVLYLWRPLTLEGGCFLAEHNLSSGSRTGGFCVPPGQKNRELAQAKSVCSGVGGTASF